MNVYDQAAFGWRPGEPTVFEKMPVAILLVLVAPLLIVAEIGVLYAR